MDILMQRRGYKIIDHMPTALKRVAPHVSVSGGADYFCFGGKGVSAIAEFKGHIVNPNNKSLTTIKAQLYEALDNVTKYQVRCLKDSQQILLLLLPILESLGTNQMNHR